MGEVKMMTGTYEKQLRILQREHEMRQHNEIVSMDMGKLEQRAVGSMFDGLKMSSREIAEKTGKRHADVRRDIEVLIKQGAILERNFALESFPINTGNGGVRYGEEYILDFKATYVLILGYDAVRRAAVIDRWMELEDERAKAKEPVFRVPQTYLEALEAHLADQKQIALVTEERDKAIKEKAWIATKREATAMVTASIATRKNKKLEELMGLNGDYRTARAIPWLKEYFDLKGSRGVWTVNTLKATH